MRALENLWQYGFKRITYIPTLSHENTNEEKTQQNPSPGPSVGGERSTLIEIRLVYLVKHA